MQVIGVLGAGTMGSGIAEAIARSKRNVVLVDVQEKALEKGLSQMEKRLSKEVAKERLSEEEKNQILGRITKSTDMKAFAPCELVIEAVIEDLTVKKTIFQTLEEIVAPSCILGTNTSALSVTELAASIKSSSRVLGIHFFNPVGHMKLVELIKTDATSLECYEKVASFVCDLNKQGIKVEEAPGFVVNRVLIPMINEAIFVLQEGVASASDIDTAMKLGANHPMGPLALADLIGLDVCLAIMETLQKEFGEDKYRPCPLLRKKVRAQQLGRKTNQGFYSY